MSKNFEQQPRRRFEWYLYVFWLILGVLILGFQALSSVALPRVMSTNFSEAALPGQINSIRINFNRLMDRKSVEENFRLSPPLPGKFSWSGRSLLYHLEDEFSYGQNYSLEVGAAALSQDGRPLEKVYRENVKMEDLQLVYVAGEGVNAGKIVIDDRNAKNPQVFTDGSYVISQVLLVAGGEKIYFLGGRAGQNVEVFEINRLSGVMRQITNDVKFLNTKIAISDDGRFLAVARLQRPDGEGDADVRPKIWLARTVDWDWREFRDGKTSGEEMRFTPGGEYLLYRNLDGNFELAQTTVGDGNLDEALFVGEYASVLDIHPFQPRVAFAAYDQQDVFAVNNRLVFFSGDGTREEVLLPGTGVVRDLVFSPNGKYAVLLFSRLEDDLTGLDSVEPQRVFHLYKYDLVSEKWTVLTDDADYSEFQPQISQDSRYILYGQAFATNHEDGRYMLLDEKSGVKINMNISGALVNFAN